MDEVIAALMIMFGLAGIFKSSLFYKSELLTSEQIARNKKIWKYGGIIILILGIIKAAVSIFWK